MNRLQEMLLAQRYRYTLTDLLVELRSDPEAIELFVEFHPHLWEDLAEQGYTALSLGQYPQAVSIFSFLLEHQDQEVAYHAAYADALCGARRYLEAAYHYDRATALAPEIPDGFFYLSEMYMMFRHPGHAIEQLEAVESLLGHDPHPLSAMVPERLDYARDAWATQG